LVTAAILADERAVAVEAITCALAGNSVRIAPNRLRRAHEIVAIVELVAAELDAEVKISAQPDRVDVIPLRR
jgi:hypothetical protein